MTIKAKPVDKSAMQGARFLCAIGIHAWEIQEVERVVMPGKYTNVIRLEPFEVCRCCHRSRK